MELEFEELMTMEVPEIEREMLTTIEEMEAYAQAKGTMGGFDTGFADLNRSLDGLNTGLILIGGQSNIGKSAYMMQLSWQVAQANRKVDEKHPYKSYVMYFTLDDNSKDLLPRIIAIDQKIPINVARTPAMFRNENGLMAKRAKGLEKLKEAAGCYKMLDSTMGTSIEEIEAIIVRHRQELAKIDPETRLVVFIDNFHDITVKASGFDQDERYDFIAGELTRIATQNDIPIVCTAEFRKLNGIRRPMLDDIRESVKTVYESKAILLCYNEVGIRGEGANVHWMIPGKDGKQPVFEVHVAKNKFNSFKGRLFYEFYPDMSLVTEATPDQAMNYTRLMS